MNVKSERRGGGFTLVEILMVLAIVLVLSVISLAVFSRVREKGRSTVCVNNLRQIALAVQQYTQDSGGYFPPEFTSRGGWQALIAPYLADNAVFFCPSSRLRRPDNQDYSYNFHQLNSIIWSPDRNPKYNILAGMHESNYEEASKTLLNSEAVVMYGDGYIANGQAMEVSCGTAWVGALHSGGANASFIDGHVKWQSQVQQAQQWCDRLFRN